MRAAIAFTLLVTSFTPVASPAHAQPQQEFVQPTTVAEVEARVREAGAKRMDATLSAVRDPALKAVATLRLTHDPNAEMRLAATRRLRNWGWERRAMPPEAAAEFDLTTAQLVRDYVTDRTGGRDAAAAVKHLRTMGLPDASLQPAVDVLADPEAKVDARVRAADLLHSLNPPASGAPAAFAAAVRAPQVSLARRALDWFMNEAKSGAEVLAAMCDPEARVRALAIERAPRLVKDQLADRAAVLAVLQEMAASDPDPAIRRRAVGMIGFVGDAFVPGEGRGEAAVLGPLVATLRDAVDDEARKAAAYSLARLADRKERAPEIVAAVERLMDEGQPEPGRRAAAEWFARDEVREHAPLDRLYALLADDRADPATARVAAKTLRDIFKHGMTGPVTRPRLERLTGSGAAHRSGVDLSGGPPPLPPQVYPAAPTPVTRTGIAGVTSTFMERLGAVTWPVTLAVAATFALLTLARFAKV